MTETTSTVGTWTWADLWEAVADRWPDAPAQRSDGRSFTWHQFDRRADGVAHALVAAGLGPGAKVSQLLFNGPEYLEVQFACSKVDLVPVNANYRYTGSELHYLWDNADAEAVVFHGDLVDRCDEVRSSLPGVRLWLWVDAGDGTTCPAWATPYEDAATAPPADRVRPASGERDGQALNLLYTGGTTGSPKGVMWPQDTLIRMLEGLNAVVPDDDDTPIAWVSRLPKPGPSALPAAPLMHGTALWYAMPVLNRGGCIVTTSNRRLDVPRLLDTIVDERVKGICIVGEAFARPILDAVAAEPDRWDLSGLRVIFTSGAMMSPETKAALLRLAPRAAVIDSLGSSESGGVARARADADAGAGTTGSFRASSSTRVVDGEGRDVVPGSGQVGRLAVRGLIPIGYYGDPVKTADTFLTIDGQVHVVAGDRAEILADGSIRLLGRGSLCINTGGEKVFPEEVEEALKGHPAVQDAVVVGLPDARFGETVNAVVEPRPGSTLDPEALSEAVRAELAGYKVPRRYVEVDSIGRAPNGKADYRALRQIAADHAGIDLPA